MGKRKQGYLYKRFLIRIFVTTAAAAIPESIIPIVFLSTVKVLLRIVVPAHLVLIILKVIVHNLLFLILIRIQDIRFQIFTLPALAVLIGLSPTLQGLFIFVILLKSALDPAS
jgi:hypothetical protein